MIDGLREVLSIDDLVPVSIYRITRWLREQRPPVSEISAKLREDVIHIEVVWIENLMPYRASVRIAVEKLVDNMDAEIARAIEFLETSISRLPRTSADSVSKSTDR